MITLSLVYIGVAELAMQPSGNLNLFADDILGWEDLQVSEELARKCFVDYDERTKPVLQFYLTRNHRPLYRVFAYLPVKDGKVYTFDAPKEPLKCIFEDRCAPKINVGKALLSHWCARTLARHKITTIWLSEDVQAALAIENALRPVDDLIMTGGLNEPMFFKTIPIRVLDPQVRKTLRYEWECLNTPPPAGYPWN